MWARLTRAVCCSCCCRDWNRPSEQTLAVEETRGAFVLADESDAIPMAPGPEERSKPAVVKCCPWRLLASLHKQGVTCRSCTRPFSQKQEQYLLACRALGTDPHGIWQAALASTGVAIISLCECDPGLAPIHASCLMAEIDSSTSGVCKFCANYWSVITVRDPPSSPTARAMNLYEAIDSDALEKGAAGETSSGQGSSLRDKMRPSTKVTMGFEAMRSRVHSRPAWRLREVGPDAIEDVTEPRERRSSSGLPAHVVATDPAIGCRNWRAHTKLRDNHGREGSWSVILLTSEDGPGPA